MQQLLLFVLLGLGSGALIAGIALAVVLTYRGSGIINIATGAIAMLSGYCYWALKTGEIGGGMATAPALVLTLAYTLAVGALVELVAFRPLRNASPLAKLVSSLGVLLIAQASMLLAFGTTQKPQPPIRPTDVVKVLGATVPVDRFILTGIVIVIAILLAALYRFTRFGLATRAASENEVNAMLAGLSANQLSMMNTLLASVVAGTASWMLPWLSDSLQVLPSSEPWRLKEAASDLAEKKTLSVQAALVAAAPMPPTARAARTKARTARRLVLRSSLCATSALRGVEVFMAEPFRRGCGFWTRRPAHRHGAFGGPGRSVGSVCSGRPRCVSTVCSDGLVGCAGRVRVPARRLRNGGSSAERRH